MLLQFISLQAEGAGFNANSLWMWGAILLVMFFFMILPQRKKQKQLKLAREAMKEGDKVVTAGGIHGKIRSVKEHTFVIEVSDNVLMTFEKTSVFASAQEATGGK